MDDDLVRPSITGMAWDMSEGFYSEPEPLFDRDGMIIANHVDERLTNSDNWMQGDIAPVILIRVRKNKPSEMVPWPQGIDVGSVSLVGTFGESGRKIHLFDV